MKKTMTTLLMILITASLFAEPLEKIDFDGKSHAKYKGEVIRWASQFRKIYEENNAEEALLLYKKGNTKIMWSFPPMVLGIGVIVGEMLPMMVTGKVNIPVMGVGIVLFGTAMYVSSVGSRERIDSIEVYNNYVKEQNSVSMNISPIITTDSVGFALALAY